jgi:hypothetical protein
MTKKLDLNKNIVQTHSTLEATTLFSMKQKEHNVFFMIFV